MLSVLGREGKEGAAAVVALVVEVAAVGVAAEVVAGVMAEDVVAGDDETAPS